MEAKDDILHILGYAVVSIRNLIDKRDLCYAISDALHNVPEQIGLVMDGKMTYEEILADIRRRCHWSNIEPWLDNALSNKHRFD